MMSLLKESDISKWYEDLDSAKADGYTVIPVRSLVQFYTLAGRKSLISKENMTPILYVLYVVFSPQEKRYYLKLIVNK